MQLPDMAHPRKRKERGQVIKLTIPPPVYRALKAEAELKGSPMSRVASRYIIRRLKDLGYPDLPL